MCRAADGCVHIHARAGAGPCTPAASRTHPCGCPSALWRAAGARAMQQQQQHHQHQHAAESAGAQPEAPAEGAGANAAAGGALLTRARAAAAAEALLEATALQGHVVKEG